MALVFNPFSWVLIFVVRTEKLVWKRDRHSFAGGRQAPPQALSFRWRSGMQTWVGRHRRTSEALWHQRLEGLLAVGYYPMTLEEFWETEKDIEWLWCYSRGILEPDQVEDSNQKMDTEQEWSGTSEMTGRNLEMWSLGDRLTGNLASWLDHWTEAGGSGDCLMCVIFSLGTKSSSAVQAWSRHAIEGGAQFNVVYSHTLEYLSITGSN